MLIVCGDRGVCYDEDDNYDDDYNDDDDEIEGRQSAVCFTTRASPSRSANVRGWEIFLSLRR